MNHFLDIHKTDPAALRAMIDSAHAMKTARQGLPKGTPDADQPLAGRMVALIFEKPSTRTRVSFDVGVRQLGGQTMVLSGKEMQLGHGETIADTARVLSRYVDLIMIRTFEEMTLLEMAEHATVPVINGLTNRTHPCQIMADVLTYEEHRGPIKGKKVVWAGDGNNVCASLLHAAGQFGFDFTFTGPETLDPEGSALDFAREKGSKVTIQRDPFTAVEGASASFWMNIASVGGALLLGWTADRFGYRWLLVSVYAGLAVALYVLAQATGMPAVLAGSAAAGLTVVGGLYVLYALAPSYYPPHIRAAGAGAAIAVGRLGSIGGPLIAGELRAAGYGPGDVLMALIPAVLLTTACVWALTTFCKPHPEA